MQDFNPKLAAFYALAKELVAEGIEPRLLVASVQLQLSEDLTISTQDKVDTMVGVGLLFREGNNISSRPKHLN